MKKLLVELLDRGFRFRESVSVSVSVRRDARYEMRDMGYEIRDTRYKIRDTRYEIRDTRYKIRDTRYEVVIMGEWARRGSRGGQRAVRTCVGRGWIATML